MRTDAVISPFSPEPVDEVLLARAPLIHVLCQIRFPRIAGFNADGRVDAFMEALRPEYPVVHEGKVLGVLLTTDGQVVPQQQDDALWILQDKAGSWQVSACQDFVSLTTTAYVSRDDYCARLVHVLEAFITVFEPPIVERVGVRYFDRIDDPGQMARLAELVRPELLGARAIETLGETTLQHSITEAVFNCDSHQMVIRWGILPAGATTELTVKASERESWLLDIDVFQQGRVDCTAQELSDRVAFFADQAYRFFRWAVTEQLLIESGGEL